MSVKGTVQRQYRALVNRAADQVAELSPPREGWVRTVRAALGMSGPELAARLGLTRARISQAEAAERSGGVTIKTMQSLAEAMGCRFVYAIVPPTGTIEDVIKAQAREKAAALVRRAGGHMALEDQALTKEAMGDNIERLAEELVRTMPADFWREPSG
jgi:predicted DNA-binding mobile mystery protein A